MKFYTFYKNLNTISACVKFVHNIYQQNKDESDNKKSLYLIISRVYIAIRVLFFTFSLAAIVCILNPIIMYVISGDVTTMLPIFLPGINEKTLNGMIILGIFHLMGIYVACIGSSASDIGHMSLILNAFAMSEMICNEFKRLDVMVKKKDEYSARHVRNTVRNIVRMHQIFRK